MWFVAAQIIDNGTDICIFTVRVDSLLCVACAGYEIPQRLKKAAFEGALTISKKKKAAKGEEWHMRLCRTERVRTEYV